MKSIKIIGLLSGVTLLATSLFGGVASAATATMSLSGATSQTTGAFSVAINVASDEAINYAEARLSFSAPVQNVSFTYNGDFTGQSCGTNCAGGYIPAGATVNSGRLATVNFTIANPGSVTVSVGSGSYVAYPRPGQVAGTINAGGAASTFTYTGGKGAEPTPTTPAPTTPAPASTKPAATTKSAGTATPVAADNGTVAGEETKAAETAATDDKKDDSKAKADDNKNDAKEANSSSNTSWLWLLAVLAIVAGFVAARRISSKTAPAAPAASEKPAKQNNKKTGRK